VPLAAQAAVGPRKGLNPPVHIQPGHARRAAAARRLVEWLLKLGGNVNAYADAQSPHTALHSAAWNGDLRMAQLLVAAARDEQCDATLSAGRKRRSR
jgi:Ankyrin repeats (many copies)